MTNRASPARNAAERMARQLKDRGWTITASGRKSAQRAADAPSGTFVADIVSDLRKAKVDEKHLDSIYQLYLETLPEQELWTAELIVRASTGPAPQPAGRAKGRSAV